jgi:hypothetical protein
MSTKKPLPLFIVSAVMVRVTDTGFGTQNKLYPISARSQEEAHGTALPLALADFPGYLLHTMCAYEVDATHRGGKL